MKKYFYIFLFITIIFFLIPSSQAKAFFESQAKFAFENKWIIMLDDDSNENIFKAMRSFLVYPEWGLPVLRKSIKKKVIHEISWQVGVLMGMLGDSSDLPYLVNIWRKIKDKELAEVFFGAIKRIYNKQRSSEINKTKLSKLSVNILGNKFPSDNKEKNVLIKYQINNFSKSNIFLKVRIKFWKTSSNEDLKTDYFLLNAGEKLEHKTQTSLITIENSESVRMDLRVWEVGSSEYFYKKTINVPI